MSHGSPERGDGLGSELLEVALRAAREAAALVAQRRAAGVSVAATKSSSVDPVTEADRASEELLRRVIADARPHDAFLGEEGGQRAAGPGEATGVRWVVDPIDGTVNFLYGLPEYAVSVAAQVDGEVEAGVVLNVATGVEYTAVRGVGSWRDGSPLTVRDPAPLAQRLVLTGFSYDAERRVRQAAAVGRLIGRVRDIRRMGSCALDLCHVADGSADAYVEEGINLWDHAAGALVAREAGARTEIMVGASGADLLLCAPGHGFEEFRASVLEAGFAGASAGESERE
ncbi:inositol monophosphatase family protein [Nocardioides pacificus]